MSDIRNDFPLFKDQSKDRNLIYFDSAATTQKPDVVIKEIANFYAHHNAITHRGIYTLAEEATTRFEKVRTTVADFLNTKPSAIIFTSGATHGINLVAGSWGNKYITEGDEVVITAVEHHSNLLPWQQLCKAKKAVLKIIPLHPDGLLNYEEAERLITEKTKLVAVVHTSHFLGITLDVKRLAKYAHKVGAKILVDATQSVPHGDVKVPSLDCDFLVFSGHKMLGPTGIGVLYVKQELQELMPPYEFGGGMVYEADYHDAQWLNGPRKFEAGTPPIAQVIGLGKAIEYLQHVYKNQDIKRRAHELCSQALKGLLSMSHVTVIGPHKTLEQSATLLSFGIHNMHAHDVAHYLSEHGICVRAGHFCAQPLAKRLGLDAAVRASFFMYNTTEEVNYLLEVIKKLKA